MNDARPPPPECPDAAAPLDVLIAVFFAARAVKTAIGGGLKGFGVHAGQEFVLEKLHRHGSITLGELAHVLDVEVPTATRTTQRMEAAGLVSRVRDPQDARQVRIQLTDRGQALRAEVNAVTSRIAEQATRGLQGQDRATLIALLWRVYHNVTDEQ